MTRYIRRMRFEKVWVDQCRATKAIKRRFGAKSALDYPCEGLDGRSGGPLVFV